MEKQYLELAYAATNNNHERIAQKRLRRIHQISCNLRNRIPHYKPEDVEALVERRNRSVNDLQKLSGDNTPPFFAKRSYPAKNPSIDSTADKLSSTKDVPLLITHPVAEEQNQNRWLEKGLRFTDYLDTPLQ